MLGVARVLFNKMGPTKGRGPLNTKRAPSLKKGYGSVGLGRHTNKGFFLLDTRLVPTFHPPPDMHDGGLKPYVSRRTPVVSGAPGWWKGSSR